MSEVISKCGVHCVGPKRNGYGEFLARIYSAGRRLSLVKCRDDFGAIDEPLALWPDVLCIGAFTDFDRLPFDYAAFEARAKLNPKVKIWEVLNEEDAPSTYAAKADLYISLAQQFAANGWALCMFNCSSGTPPYPSEDDGVSYREIARACKYMIDNGYTAYLGLHEYDSGSETGTIGRFAYLADYLEAQGALLPIAIGEYGFVTHPSDAEFMAMVQRHDPVYMADPRVLGCAAWTLGGSGWAGSNFQTALPQLGEYIATIEPIGPPAGDVWRFEHYHITDNPIVVVMDRAHTVIVNAVQIDAEHFLLTIQIDPPEARVEVILTPPQPIGGYVVGQSVEIFTRSIP